MKSKLIDQLETLESSKNDGRGISFVKEVIMHLRNGNIEKAKVVWSWDGDKVETENRDVRDFLIKHLGCRLHGKIGCQKWLCKEND